MQCWKEEKQGAGSNEQMCFLLVTEISFWAIVYLIGGRSLHSFQATQRLRHDNSKRFHMLICRSTHTSRSSWTLGTGNQSRGELGQGKQGPIMQEGPR